MATTPPPLETPFSFTPAEERYVDYAASTASIDNITTLKYIHGFGFDTKEQKLTQAIAGSFNNQVAAHNLKNPTKKEHAVVYEISGTAAGVNAYNQNTLNYIHSFGFDTSTTTLTNHVAEFFNNQALAFDAGSGAYQRATFSTSAATNAATLAYMKSCGFTTTDTKLTQADVNNFNKQFAGNINKNQRVGYNAQNVAEIEGTNKDVVNVGTTTTPIYQTNFEYWIYNLTSKDLSGNYVINNNYLSNILNDLNFTSPTIFNDIKYYYSNSLGTSQTGKNNASIYNIFFTLSNQLALSSYMIYFDITKKLDPTTQQNIFIQERNLLWNDFIKPYGLITSPSTVKLVT